tara:strand:+ start:533 stop:763 length:231 start_codon:yes stop_codon:yes gene_type:complete
MIISGLDFFLINALIYVSGVGTGLLICCKYKDKLMIRSRSRENLSQAQYATPVITEPSLPSAVLPSAPTVTKITLE